MYEKELRDKLLKELQDIKGTLELGEEVPIPYKHIYLPNDNMNRYKTLYITSHKIRSCKINI